MVSNGAFHMLQLTWEDMDSKRGLYPSSGSIPYLPKYYLRNPLVTSWFTFMHSYSPTLKNFKFIGIQHLAFS